VDKSVTVYNIPLNKISKIIHTHLTGSVIQHHGSQVISGHDNGNIIIWCAASFVQLSIVEASMYKITSCLSLGTQLWLGLATGKILVYEGQTLFKEFFAIEGEIASIEADLESIGVVAVSDKGLKLLDGLLENDFCGRLMLEEQARFCTYRDIKVLVASWNVNAIRPIELKNEVIFDVLLKGSTADVIVFGFQELIDLEMVG